MSAKSSPPCRFERIGTLAIQTDNEVCARETGCGVERMPLNAAGDAGEVEPDLDAAKVRAFRANRRCDVGAKVTRRADVFCELRMDFAQLRNFVHGGGVHFFLRVETCAHGPFVQKMKK